jgi:hypothetical protein
MPLCWQSIPSRTPHRTASADFESRADRATTVRRLPRTLQPAGQWRFHPQLASGFASTGGDPDSLFIPDDYEWGLRAPRAPGYVVENAARRQLERKLTHLEDGTIAVCGPQGAGKTTLLEQSVEKAGNPLCGGLSMSAFQVVPRFDGTDQLQKVGARLITKGGEQVVS